MLRNAVDIVRSMQNIANQSYAASKPMSVVYGEVINVTPLKIKVDQKLELTEEFLVLTRNVIDYEIEMTVDHRTENTAGGSGEASFASHNHAYTGKKIFLVHNALKIGEQVIMLRDNGGQKYVILDKVVSV